MRGWAAAAHRRLAAGEACVVVTIAALRGSGPREAGARMVVTREGFEGTVGGGALEFEALALARRLLAEAEPEGVVREFVLGPEFGQCCGGRAELVFECLREPAPWLERAAAAEGEGGDWILVTGLDAVRGLKQIHRAGAMPAGALPAAVEKAVREKTPRAGGGPVLCRDESSGARYLIEPLTRRDPPLWLFGAGHVGHALVRVMEGLPFAVRWFDERAEAFPSSWPGNVSVESGPGLVRRLDAAPAGAYYLVMTHSHALDFAICERVLERGDFAYLGLIGSTTKRARFEAGFRARGFPEALVARLVCPIGVSGIGGKAPGEIAVATASQLLRRVGKAKDAEAEGTAS